jgi:hypothetical protein
MPEEPFARRYWPGLQTGYTSSSDQSGGTIRDEEKTQCEIVVVALHIQIHFQVVQSIISIFVNWG